MTDRSNTDELKAHLKVPLAKRLVASIDAAKKEGSSVDVALHAIVATRLAEIKAELKS